MKYVAPVCPMPPRGPMLTQKKLDAFKDQILLVLADYRDTVPTPLSVDDPKDMGSKNPLAAEGTRIEIANRLIENLKIIAKVR